MFRSSLVILCLVACAAGDNDDVVATSDITSDISIRSFHRERVAGDVYHYELRVQIGAAPNAALQIHRFVREIAPFIPRHTSHAAMLLHGDFSTVLTNFAPALGEPASPAPGLAPYLAAHDVDVWGLDRRWTLPAADGDISDLGTMSVAQELDDLRATLALARAVRTADGSGSGRLSLLGFSHGAELAYLYAAVEGARPAAQRHVGGLVALDFLVTYAPANDDLRQATCALAAGEYAGFNAGVTDASNEGLIQIGELSASDPDGESPIFGPPYTNRQVMLVIAGQTYQIGVPYAPVYHLLAPMGGDQIDPPTGFRYTTDAAANAWFAGAAPHESNLEGAELDAQACGDAPPIAAPLANIHVPLLYVGAAGGVGALGLYTTTQVSSTDVTARVFHRVDPADQDFGHGDLLYASDAPTTVYPTIAGWLASH